MTTPRTPAPPETPEPAPEQPPDEDPGWFDGLRGPQGCAEWAVVILGVVWVVLAIVFVVALIVRLSG
jgi:hypothetical protein